jgi:hypothetical protein
MHVMDVSLRVDSAHSTSPICTAGNQPRSPAAAATPSRLTPVMLTFGDPSKTDTADNMGVVSGLAVYEQWE